MLFTIQLPPKSFTTFIRSLNIFLKQVFAGGLQNTAKFRISEKSLENIFGEVFGGKVADLDLQNDSITDFPGKAWNIPILQIYKWTK